MFEQLKKILLLYVKCNLKCIVTINFYLFIFTVAPLVHLISSFAYFPITVFSALWLSYIIHTAHVTNVEKYT